MKFTCEKQTLLREISIAQDVIASKNAISILSNIYLEAANDSLIIKATDMKVNFETSVPVTVIEPGSTTVFGDKFYGIISSFPHDEIEFSKKDSNVTIKPIVHKRPEYKLKSIAADNFPEFSVSNTPFFEIPIKDFKNMVQQTVFAVSDDQTRYFMNGVFFEKVEDKLNMVATDGRRLAFYGKKPENEISDFAGVIIPPKILSIIVKRSGDEGLISISISDKTIFANFASYKFSSVLIEGNFPNYRKVIPEKQEFSLSVKRDDMINALRRVALMIEQKSYRVYFDISTGKLSVYSEESEIGNVQDEIPCEYEGADITIALNYRYIEEPLKVIGEEDIILHFTEATKAITMEPSPAKDFFHIVMPMQT